MIRITFLSLFLFAHLTARPTVSAEAATGEDAEAADLEMRIRRILQLPVDEEPSPATSTSANGSTSRPEEEEQVDELISQLEGELNRIDRWFWLNTVEVALGYQQNVLKDPEGDLDSAFLSGNVESSGVWMRQGKPVLSLYALAERREYLDGDEDVPHEDFVLLYGDGTVGLGQSGRNRIRAEGTGFYLRQVMEDPLAQGAADLLALWNLSLRAGWEHELEDHTFFAGYLFQGEDFDEEALDNSSNGLFLRWTWELSDALQLKSDLDYSRTDYDQRLAREATGVPIADSLLALDEFGIAARLRWKPAIDWIKSADLTIKARREKGSNSPYDSNRLFQLANGWKFAWGKFNVQPQASLGYRKYDDRQIGLDNPEVQWKWNWGASLAVQYALTRHLQTEIRYQFNEADSNRESLVYSADSVQLNLGWQF